MRILILIHRLKLNGGGDDDDDNENNKMVTISTEQVVYCTSSAQGS